VRLSFLVVDGARYQLWSPPDEEADFRPLVEEHLNEIFGNPSMDFNLRHTIRMLSGKGGIPDSFVLSLGAPPVLWVVENELARHPVYQHIMSQLGKFMNAMKQPAQRMELVDRLYDAISSDQIKEATIKKVANPRDVYKFVSDLVTKARFVIIIDEDSEELKDACNALPNRPDVITLKTYVRDPNNPAIHACVFDSLANVKLARVIQFRGARTPSSTKSLDFEFWQGLADYSGTAAPDLKLRKPRAQHWYSVSVGSSEASISLTLNTQKNLLGCGLYIPRKKKLFEYLSKNRSVIEGELGEKLDWQALPSKKASRISLVRSGDIANRAEWEGFFRWFTDTTLKFQRAFRGPLREAKGSL